MGQRIDNNTRSFLVVYRGPDGKPRRRTFDDSKADLAFRFASQKFGEIQVLDDGALCGAVRRTERDGPWIISKA